MKLTIERATLLKALGHVQAVVEKRNTIPILSNVLISAGPGGAAKLAPSGPATWISRSSRPPMRAVMAKAS